MEITAKKIDTKLNVMVLAAKKLGTLENKQYGNYKPSNKTLRLALEVWTLENQY